VIRVANDSVIRSLKSGALVETVTVYGLLASHADRDCLPMKYFCDYMNISQIEVGITGDFAEHFYCAMQC